MKHYFWLNKEIKIIHGYVTVPEIKGYKLLEVQFIDSDGDCGRYVHYNYGNGYRCEAMKKDELDPEFQVQLMLLGVL